MTSENTEHDDRDRDARSAAPRAPGALPASAVRATDPHVGALSGELWNPDATAVRKADLDALDRAAIERYKSATRRDPRSATDWRIAVAAGAALSLLGTLAGAWFAHTYGFALFLATPGCTGVLSAVLAGRRVRQPIQRCVTAALCAQLLGGAALFAFALEGAICLLMAAPLLLPMAALGALAGYTFQRGGAPARGFPVVLPALLLAPLLTLFAEKCVALRPPLQRVISSVEIAAPPEVVWSRVVDFPALPPATQWLFRAGVAAPLCARIDGCGVGAVRYCEFTTGPFVEPIEVWDEPRLLRFGVTRSPPPMAELSPFEVHPPHLHGFLNARRGQFRLIALADGRTRLEGTTWYDNRMWPQAYWRLWSDPVIHEIHLTVLRHVRALAENDAR